MRDREHLWLPLLRALTAAIPSWLVWKNVESALTGVGDVDSAAAPGSWPQIATICTVWSRQFQLGPVIECRHIPGGLNLVLVPSERQPLLELSVKNTKSWRGAPLFSLTELTSLAEDDPRGFRHLRPGAEGVFKMLLNGTTWTGGAHTSALRAKDVAALIAADPAGVRQAAELLGAEDDVRRMAAAVLRGEWDRKAALRVQNAALREAVRTPGSVAARANFRLLTSRHCPVLKTLLHNRRRLTVEPEVWWEQVRRDHVVYEAPGKKSTPRRRLIAVHR